jgi:uncharacterized membrane protein
MNKARLEALSDGVFSIVMTILVFSIKIPTLTNAPTNEWLWSALQGLGTVFFSYFVSFFVLAMFWLSHHFFYSVLTKNIDRALALLNILYLSFIALIPFSAELLGIYPEVPLSGVIYGLNLIVISVIALIVLNYAIYSKEIDTSHVEKPILARAKIRVYLTLGCSAAGAASAFVSHNISLILFAFPIVFNVIPGLLDKVIDITE